MTPGPASRRPAGRVQTNWPPGGGNQGAGDRSTAHWIAVTGCLAGRGILRSPVSSPATRHSRNLAERPGAGIVIFDSHVPAGNAQAVYLTATAEEVSVSELARCIDVYSARSQAMGLRRWTPDEVSAPAPHRLYRAIATETFGIDGFDQRIPVEIS